MQKKSETMKILVTGSQGLVGKKVTELLVQKNHAVVAFDHSNGCDILDARQLEKQLQGCDAVVHCAARLNEKQGKDLLWNTNVDGTQNVVNACVKQKITRLVFLSSVGVYGNQSGSQNEESTLAPETTYEKSKARAEEIIRNSGVSYTIIRSAIVLGPNPQWKRLVGFVQKNIPLIGSGKQAWQTVYYEDLADAVIFLLFSKFAQNEIFIVAGKERPTLLEFTRSIRKALGKNGNDRTVPLWFGKLVGKGLGAICWVLQKQNPLSKAHLNALMQERSYDISKIEKLGWKNTFSFEDAIKATVTELRKPDDRA